MRPSSFIRGLVLAATACGDSDPAGDVVDGAIACDPGVHDLADPEDAPYRLLVAGEHVYWTSARLDGPKRVRRAAIATDAVETVTETPREVGALAVDADGSAYWVESTPSTNAGVVMVARPASPPQVLYTVPGGLDAFGVAIDDTSVYWIVHGRGSAFTQTVFHGPKEGGTASALGSISMPTSDQSIGGMGTDGGFVYWSNGGSLLSRLARTGGPATTILDDPDGVGSFVIEDGVVYAIVRDAAASIVRVDAAATPPARSTFDSGHGARWSLALAHGRLFTGTSDDRILSIPVGGGEPIVEVSEGVRTAGGIAITGRRLYWANTAISEAGGAVRYMCRAM
jgi:hypothetical protein